MIFVGEQITGELDPVFSNPHRIDGGSRLKCTDSFCDSAYLLRGRACLSHNFRCLPNAFALLISQYVVFLTQRSDEAREKLPSETLFFDAAFPVFGIHIGFVRLSGTGRLRFDPWRLLCGVRWPAWAFRKRRSRQDAVNCDLSIRIGCLECY